MPVELSARELSLLQLLLENAGRVMTRAQLEASVYGWRDEPDSNALEVHIHHLLVVAGIDEAAQDDGGAPEIRFEFLLRHALAHDSHPPSVPKMTEGRSSVTSSPAPISTASPAAISFDTT